MSIGKRACVYAREEAMTTAQDVIATAIGSNLLDPKRAQEAAEVVLAALLSADESVRLELAAKLNPPKEGEELSRLWNAIVANTQRDMFWIGEILLNELTKETGFPVRSPDGGSENCSHCCPAQNEPN